MRAPSADLDARMEKLFAAPRPPRRNVMMRPVRMWHLAAACAACAAIAFLAGLLARDGGQPPPAQTVEVHYVVEDRPQEYDVFDWTRYPKRVAPPSVLKRARNNAEHSNQT
ncbi:MAG: hypothetical protein IT368_10835 [Candidatus Hydrogenedentes bacterium]|nr:hypothetical protein [Candidatus Hydrogenedentota bacterium]